MCEYLHVLTHYDGRPFDIIRFIKANFPNKKHKFLIISDRDWVIRNNSQLLAFPDVIYLPVINRTIISRITLYKFYRNIFNKADYILWHTLDTLKSPTLLLSCMKKQTLQKSVWVESIGTPFCINPRKNIRSLIMNKMLEHMKKTVPFVGVSLASDQKGLESLASYMAGKKYFELPVPILPKHVETLRNTRGGDKKSDQKQMILVGYDGLSYNEHQKILDALTCFKNENFSVVMPMNFAMAYEYGMKGTRKYKAVIKAYGEKALNRPVAAVQRGAVPEESYFLFLSRADAAVFSGKRPIYLDMLIYLLYMDKRVFLSSEHFLYHYLISQGLDIGDTSSLTELPFEEIVRPARHISRKWIEQRLSDQESAEYWKKCFEFLEGKKDI